MIEPTAEEVKGVDSLGDILRLKGFTWTIYKAKPDTPAELSRWDVEIKHTAHASSHFGFGQSTRLADAVVQACECLERIVRQKYDDLERAPYSKEIKQIVRESKRLTR